MAARLSVCASVWSLTASRSASAGASSTAARPPSASLAFHPRMNSPCGCSLPSVPTVAPACDERHALSRRSKLAALLSAFSRTSSSSGSVAFSAVLSGSRYCTFFLLDSTTTAFAHTIMIVSGNS
eukprot:jgi/Chrpa1/7630/Chrysochromulina_OHIO_Genome00018757-RA